MPSRLSTSLFKGNEKGKKVIFPLIVPLTYYLVSTSAPELD